MSSSSVDGPVMLDYMMQHPYRHLFVYLFSLYVLNKLLNAFVYSKLRKVPGPALARLTTLRALYNRLSGTALSAALADFRTHGDIYVSRPDTVTICNPEDVRTVLGSLDSWKVDVYKGLDDPAMRNLVTLSHPQLASQRRRQISPYLNSPSYLAKMEEVVLRHGAQSLIQQWGKLVEEGNGKAEINYRNDTQLAIFNIMGALAFGRVDCGKENGNTIVDWIAATAVYIGASINFKCLLKFPLALLIRPSLRKYKELMRYGKESVAQRRQLLGEGSTDKPADLLQAFIDAEDPDSKLKLTSSEVQAECIGMQLAGSEPTAAALTWAFHFLTLYPSVLSRVVEEIQGQFAKSHLITYADCRHLPFLEAFVYETFRYAPITSDFIPRRSEKELCLQGHRIPAGTNIAFNLVALNNRPDVWDVPERFNPDRFVGNDDAKRDIFAFSYGPRSCIGRDLAWMNIMSILANVLNTFDIELPEAAAYGPHHMDSKGIPVLMPSQCHIFRLTDPESDCRLLVSRRT